MTAAFVTSQIREQFDIKDQLFKQFIEQQYIFVHIYDKAKQEHLVKEGAEKASRKVCKKKLHCNFNLINFCFFFFIGCY